MISRYEIRLAAWWLLDRGAKGANEYFKLVKTLSKLSVLAIPPLFLLATFAVATGSAQVLAFAVVVAGLFVTLLLVSLLPLGAIAGELEARVQGVRRAIRWTASVLLWFLLLGLYFYLVPISNNPRAVVLVGVVAFALAVLWVGAGVRPNPRRVYGMLVSVLLVTTAGLFLPQTSQEITKAGQRLDAWLASCLSPGAVCIGEQEVASSLADTSASPAGDSRSLAPVPSGQATPRAPSLPALSGVAKELLPAVDQRSLDGLDNDIHHLFVAIAGDEPRLVSRIVRDLRAVGFEARNDVFRAALVDDHLVDGLRNADASLLNELGFDAFRGHVLLGQLEVTPAEESTVGNVLRVQISLDATLLPLKDGRPANVSLSVRGAGFSAEDALRQAQGELSEQLVELPLLVAIR